MMEEDITENNTINVFIGTDIKNSYYVKVRSDEQEEDLKKHYSFPT